MLRKSRYTSRRKGERKIGKIIRNKTGRSEKGRHNEEERGTPYMAHHLSLPETAI